MICGDSLTKLTFFFDFLGESIARGPKSLPREPLRKIEGFLEREEGFSPSSWRFCWYRADAVFSALLVGDDGATAGIEETVDVVEDEPLGWG